MAEIKITRITPQKNLERVSLYSDSGFVTGIDKELLLKFGLSVGSEINEERLALILAEDELAKCLNKAYRYLSFRPRSEQEVTQKLLERYPEETVGRAINRLKEYGYVDDKSFAEFWIEGRGKTRGSTLLRTELLQKGVDRELVKDCLGELDAETTFSNALRLVETKRRYQNLSTDELYRKVAPFLARRGYSYETIREVVAKLKSEK